MAERYQFVWGEVEHIGRAISLARMLEDDVKYAHIETDEFDLDMDKTGIRVRIPHDRDLNEERKEL